MQLSKTWPQTLAYGETKLGIPYSEVLDGGVGPDYFDCSGLMQNIMRWAGDPNFLRDTYEQWGDGRYLHMGPYGFGQAPKAQAGWIAYIHVAGEPDPGHVGICIGDGTYLNAPHTGAVVRIEAIPNTASEHVYGYLVPEYAGAAPPPPYAPPKEEGMIAKQDNGPGYWVVRSDGNVYAFAGAPYLGPLPKYLTQWGIGSPANPVVGIVSDGQGGFTLAADSGGTQPNIYHVTSDGAYAK